MAVYHWLLYPVNKKKVFFVSVYRINKGTEDYLPKQYLTIGKEPDCEINPIPGFPERHRLLERAGKGYNLIIPSDLEGTITRGNISLPINGIIEFGLLKKKGNSCIFPILENEGCVLTINDSTLTFGYKEIILPEKRKKEKIDRSLKKPLINKEDYSFLTIFVITVIINFSMATYLNSIEIKKKEDPLEAIKKMPQRFAKLILQPPKPKAQKIKVEESVKENEKKEEKKDEKKEEETKKDSEEEIETPRETKEIETPKDIEKQAGPQEVAMIPPSEGISTASAREQIREKVKTKGLLGVIMAKAMPGETGGGIVLSDVENIVTSLEKGGNSYSGDRKVGGGEDILSPSNILEDISKRIIEKQPEIKPSDTQEIISEKKEIAVGKFKSEESHLPSIIKKREEAEVYRVVSSYVGGLKYLYNNALRKNPSLKGKITVKIIVSLDGKVVKAEVISSTLDFLELEEAIINRIYKWRFSEMKDVEDFTIDYTFDFAPVG